MRILLLASFWEMLLGAAGPRVKIDSSISENARHFKKGGGAGMTEREENPGVAEPFRKRRSKMSCESFSLRTTKFVMHTAIEKDEEK